jgi:hypothetical protein
MPRYSVDLDVVEKADVLVVGGGPAGIAAAVASSRLGVKTVLLERYGFLGGTATAAMVGPWMTAFSKSGKVQIVRGIFDELVKRMEAEGGAIHPSKIEPGTNYSGFIVSGHSGVTPFDSECLKRVAADYCLDNYVELRLHSFLVDAFKSPDAGDPHAGTGQSVVAVMASKSGLQAISAKLAIDCTGDGDVAARMGVETEKGRRSDGKMQPCTMFFRIRNIDSEVLTKHVMERYPPQAFGNTFGDIVVEAKQAGKFNVPKTYIRLFKDVYEDEWRVNTSRILDIDGTKVEDLIRAEVEGRRQVKEIFEFIKERIPGCEKAILVDTGSQIGLRETRRIVGRYLLTEQDVVSCRDFEDSVVSYAYPLDIHNPAGTDTIFREIEGEAYHIPYRCLLARDEEQLLAAGRCASSTHEAMAAIRVMPCCFAMGEAAGTAAAMSLRKGTLPSELDPGELRKTLLEQGVYLGDGKE